MVIIFFNLVYSICLFFFYGFFLTTLLLSIYGNKEEIADVSMWVITLMGCVVIAFILGGMSIFLPVSGKLHIIFILGGLAIFGYFRKDIISFFRHKKHNISTFYVSILLCIAIFPLLYSALKIDHYDTGLYYAQSIKWIEHYPAIPGLANVHGRFGFNSTWLMLAAFTGFGRLGLHLYQIPSLLIFVIFIAYLLHLIKNNSNNYLHLLGFCFLVILLFISFWHRKYNFDLASASTDLPAMIITWWIFLLAAEFLLGKKAYYYPFILILSIFSLSVKLSSAPILLIPIFLGSKEISRGKLKQVIKLIGIAFLLISPWVIRNIILTGYVFYPVASLDLFNFDWKVPPEYVISEADWVKSWARIPGQNKDIVLSKSTSEWFPIWIKEQNRQDLTVLVSIVLLPILWVITLFKKKRSIKWEEYLLVAFALVGCIFWFIQAPHFRFGYGFLIPAFLFLLMPLVIAIYNRFRENTNMFLKLAFLTTIIFLTYHAISTIKLSDVEKYILFPAKYPVPPVETFDIDGQLFYRPSQGDQCWYDPFPCTPFPLNFQLRGDTVQEGFFFKAP
jgi:hypothetical protein